MNHKCLRQLEHAAQELDDISGLWPDDGSERHSHLDKASEGNESHGLNGKIPLPDELTSLLVASV